MRYLSTRGDAPDVDFRGVLLAGLAPDGGLYVPAAWPELNAAEWRALAALPYPALAARIVALFSGGAMPEVALERIAADAYARFAHPAVAPLRQVEHGLWSLELFHGPTLAFKDLAMQFLGGLFGHVLADEGRRITVIGATSGDTGSAAIEALRDRAEIAVAILHPHGRTSAVQRRQMTTVTAPNVLNLAVEGHFDDCQALVKAMFADRPFRDAHRLAAVNSINWARIAAQVPYYAYAALALGAPDRPVDVAVPTGNFGNVFAAWVARRMGLPIRHLVIGSNRNDILGRFISGNDMTTRAVEPSLSPSMDIQVSSNFERFLFELLDRDADTLRTLMCDFAAGRRLAVPDAAWRRAGAVVRGFTVDDALTLDTMRTLASMGLSADPHSAIGVAAARAHRTPDVPMIAVATAHPAKFPDAVHAATGAVPALPPHLADLDARAERFTAVANALAPVEALIAAHARAFLAA